MFTGIVEEIGEVLSWRHDTTATLRIAARVGLDGTRLGDSIAVEGACLTVTALGPDWFEVGLAPETLRRTNLADRQPGDGVNLERATAAGGRMGGHYVQGHVDGTSQIVELRPDGSSLLVQFAIPPGLERYIVEKGFVAVDGISLTITNVGAGGFGVALIEYTQAAVTLPRKAVGATVNLEVDVLAKYVERLLEARFGGSMVGELTEVQAASPFATIAEAIAEFQAGRFVLIVDDEDRENEGDLVIAAEFCGPSQVNFMAREARGLICVPLLGKRLDELQIPMMVPRMSGSLSTAFTVSVDAAEGTTTGISAADRALTVKKLIDPSTRPDELLQPGHIFPLRYMEGGVLRRAGHTEASVDLARLSGTYPGAVICEIMADDGTMARLPQLKVFAQRHGIKMITVAQLVQYRRRNETLVRRAVETALPTEYGNFTVVAYESLVSDEHHLAIVKGDVRVEPPPLVRMHSECLTGDVFGSMRCDCGAQLRLALQRIAVEGRGVVIYLRHHEGRGIGLVPKLKAYNLQDAGMDTVEANVHLGFPADLRDYGVGAQILVDLGLTRLRLLTNNPSKRAGLQGFGLEVVERVPLTVPASALNETYLRTKVEKMGHLLELEGDAYWAD